MAIASIEFGVLITPPTPPLAGKKLFLGEGDAFKTVDTSGNIEPINSGGAINDLDARLFNLETSIDGGTY
jgi:hypothetical protein